MRVSEFLHCNTATFPASQLKAVKALQRKANRLPDGSTLIVLPAGNGRLEVVAQKIRLTIYRQGRKVTISTVH